MDNHFVQYITVNAQNIKITDISGRIRKAGGNLLTPALAKQSHYPIADQQNEVKIYTSEQIKLNSIIKKYDCKYLRNSLYEMGNSNTSSIICVKRHSR